MKLRIVKARTALPGEFRAAAEKIPSPSPDHMSEAIHSPSQLTRRIQEHQRTRVPESTPVPRTDAPAPPNMVDYIRKDK